MTALRQGGRDDGFVAPSYGRLRVMTTRAKKIWTQLAHVSIELWQSITKILLGARAEGTPGWVMSIAGIMQAFHTCVDGISVR